MKSDPLNEFVEKGITSPAFDLTIEYADIALHEFCDNDLIKDLPIIKSIVAVVKIRNSVAEVFFLKKLLTFLKELHSKTLTQSEISEFTKRYDGDTKYKSQVIEQVIIMNDRFISVEKSKLYAHLFKAHLFSKLSWDNLIALTAVLDVLNLKALPHLMKLCEAPGYKLQSWMSTDSRLLLTASGLGGHFRDDYIASQLGLLFYHFGVLNDYSKSDVELNKLAAIYAQYPRLLGNEY